MSVQAKEPISEAENSALRGHRFGGRAQAFDLEDSSLSPINIGFSSTVFLVRFRRFFTLADDFNPQTISTL